jgi:uncharacterized protein (TIGR02646 family)
LPTSSHVEHIKPKSLDIATLTFDYANLLVSCEGNHFNKIGDNSKKNNCGHLKDDDFDEILFLNPTIITNISEYFIFDTNGVIESSNVDTAKAVYTLKLLNLNGKNGKLAEARKKAREMQLRVLRNSTYTEEEQKEKLNAYLQNNTNEFITFLRYTFRPLEK